MKDRINTRYYTLLIFAVTSFVAAILLNGGYEDSQKNYSAKTKQFQAVLTSQEKKILAFNTLISNNIEQQNFKTIDQCIPPQKLHHIDNKWYSLLIFKNDSLVYWSDNRIAFRINELLKYDANDIVFLSNGWYQIFPLTTANYKIIGLYCLKTEYKIKNEFLQDKFNPVLPAENNVKIIKSRSALNAYPVYNNSKDYLFSLSFDSTEFVTPKLIPMLYLFGILCLCLYLYEYLSHLRKTNKTLVYLVLLGLLAVRIIVYVFSIPKGLYSLELFNPALFAGYYSLRSLGDLLLSTLVLAFWKIFVYQDIASIRISPKYAKSQVLYALVLSPAFLVTFLYSTLIHYLQYNLIFNSKISLEVNNLFELNSYSYAVMFIVFVLMFSYFLLTDAIVKSIIGSYRDWKFHAVVLLAAMACFLLFVNNFLPSEIYRTYDYTTFILAVVVIILLYFFRTQNRKLFSFVSAFTVIVVFSIYTAYLVNSLNHEKELQQRILVASKIAEKKDPVAEYLFSDNTEKQLHDKILLSYFDELRSASEPSKGLAPQRIIQRINQLYFNDAYWSKYEKETYLFNENKQPITENNSFQLYSYNQLVEMIDTIANSTAAKNFYQINNVSSRYAYLASITITDPDINNAVNGYAFVLMHEKLGGAKKGFPQLLEKENANAVKINSFDKYSWAFYKNNSLIDKGGKFSFDDNLLFYTNSPPVKNIYYIEKNNIQHLVYKISTSDVLLVTLTDNLRFKLFTEATYWFAFFFLLFLFFWLMMKILNRNLNIEFSFKNRIQISVMAIVLLSMILIGSFTVYFINSNYKKNQRLQLLEKLNSLQLVIENEYDNAFVNDFNNDTLAPIFSRTSNALDCDFIIYNKQGVKSYSTKPTLFSLNIIGNLINREAYNKLSLNASSSFVQNEMIGNLKYLSSYTGLYDSNNNLLAYINLPYITDPDELKNQISEFIITLVNVYVPLFLLCLLLTFLSANQLAKPLQTLQKSMAKVRLGKATEPIVWDKADEIGALIKQYNKMVDELALSANKLARSERESAWREMAKQVAHEIKNPLTPMKLSVQHLQRAWQDQSPNLMQIVPRLSASIIEQIDTLSAIATEFSNFAKMPTAQFTVVDIQSVLKSSADLFAKEGNTTIEYLAPENVEYKIFADREQLLRVFSNLLKNALQAIPEETNGVIKINIEKLKTHFLVTIKDNGKGISETEKSKIFVPYFTTKSFGTGLGLAIVKNIVEAANGTIWFESEQGKGTTFFIQLPIFKDYSS